MRAVLVGNYGVGNAGDEALREYFLHAFPDVEWFVLSARPSAGEYPRLPFGPRSLLFTPWWKTIAAYRKADAVVFGGGSLLTDIEMVRACFIWWCHAAVARMFGKPVYLAFQGVGPFRTKTGEWLARSVCKKAAFISVRDEASAVRVRSWELGKEVIQTFDPVFSLYQAKKCSGCSQDVIAFIPRMNSGKSFENAAKKALEDHPGIPVEIWLLQADYPGEKEVGDLLASTFGGTVISVPTLRVLAEKLVHARLIVTERYHAALLAYAMDVPRSIVSQREGDKLDELRQMIIAGETSDQLRQKIERGEQALRSLLI